MLPPSELLANTRSAIYAIETGEPMPPATRRWLLAGLRALLAGRSLRAGFGLPRQQARQPAAKKITDSNPVADGF